MLLQAAPAKIARCATRRAVGWTEALRSLKDGGWPLPTAGGRRHAHLPTTSSVCTVRPNLSSAVGSEDKDKQAYMRPECPVSSHRRLACLRPLGTRIPEALVPHPRHPAGAAPYSLLLDLGLAAGILQLLLCCLGVGLVDAFLDRLRCAVDDVLGFLESQAGELAHCLDHVDLVVADGGQHHGELGLLFDGRRRGGGRRRGSDGSSGGNAELLFHRLDELGQLEDGHRRNLVEDFSLCNSHDSLLVRKFAND